eukprot:TRINITY_DN22736_c0_g1_i1.p1 TRINITY_DN22736_c0_g1~~TRINITY_DN22736_c0_g1_i1.p1  ORF type:complete len:645 (+),score=152.36 TRINITY_DN22736_c0_g1_i1:55-1989(+)
MAPVPEDREFELVIEVPPTVKPGITKLSVDVGDGSKLFVLVPKQAVVGDRLRLTQSGGEPWKCAILRSQPPSAPAPAPLGPATQQLLVPADVEPGKTKLLVTMPGGDQVQLAVPDYVRPGDVIELERQDVNEGWTCKFIRDKLIHPEDNRSSIAVMADLGKHLRAASLDADAAVNNLLAVAKAAGCFVSPKMKRGRAPPLNIPGLLATEAIDEGEELIRVPHHLHLTPRSVDDLAPALAAAVRDLPDTVKSRCDEGMHTFFLGRLLGEAEERALAKMNGSDIEAKSVLESEWAASESQRKVWEAYADSLLTEDFEYHPFRLAAFNPDGMRTSLKPSLEAEYFIDMATDLVSLHKAISGCGEAAFGSKPVEVEMFLRARLSSQTRVFQTCVDTTLVPVADLLNQSSTVDGAGVLWSWDSEANAMIIKAVRAHAPGEELFTTYGSRSNMLLYRTYGFTLRPENEPGWTYIVRSHIVRPVLNTYLGSEDARTLILLETSHIDESLCKVLNQVSSRGRDGVEFLRLLCARIRWEYETDEKMRPALEALACARAKDPRSHAWWSYIDEEHRHLIEQDSFRVIMSEYLCLTAHIEAADVVDGKKDESTCLGGCATMRCSLVNALHMLRNSGGFSLQLVSPVAEQNDAQSG